MDFEDLFVKVFLSFVLLLLIAVFCFLTVGLFQSIKLQNLEIKEKENNIKQSAIEYKII